MSSRFVLIVKSIGIGLLACIPTSGCVDTKPVSQSIDRVGDRLTIASSEWQNLFANITNAARGDVKDIYEKFVQEHSKKFIDYVFERGGEEVDKRLLRAQSQMMDFIRKVALILEQYGELAKIDNQGFLPHLDDICREISRIEIQIAPQVTKSNDSIVCWTPTSSDRNRCRQFQSKSLSRVLA
jgi:NAD-dependent DNA ligase adenylation domain